MQGAAEKSGKIRPGNLLHAVDNQSGVCVAQCAHDELEYNSSHQA